MFESTASIRRKYSFHGARLMRTYFENVHVLVGIGDRCDNLHGAR